MNKDKKEGKINKAKGTTSGGGKKILDVTLVNVFSNGYRHVIFPFPNFYLGVRLDEMHHISGLS